MIFLIPIILSLLPIIHKLYNNFSKWKRGVPVDHNKEWRIYAIWEMTTAGIIFSALAGEEQMSLLRIVLLFIVVGFMIASWFWLLFDWGYNLLRRWWNKKTKRPFKHFTLWYTGTNDKDDATTDNFLQRLTLWQHIAVKFGLIIIFTTLYIWNWF